MIYGGDADRPEWMTSSRTYPLLNATGRAVVDWVETRRHPGVDDVIRLHDTMAREKRAFEPADPEAHHHVCVRADRLWPRPYRQCPAGGGVRPAAPGDRSMNFRTRK